MKNGWFDSIMGVLIGSPAGAVILGGIIGFVIQIVTGASQFVSPWAPNQPMPLWVIGAFAGIVVWCLFLVVVVEVLPRLLKR